MGREFRRHLVGRFWFAASAAVEAPGQLDSCSLRATLHINPCNTPDLPWAREVLLPQTEAAFSDCTDLIRVPSAIFC